MIKEGIKQPLVLKIIEMDKKDSQSFKHYALRFLISCSIIMNLLFFIRMFVLGDNSTCGNSTTTYKQQQRSWSEKAAEEAEEVAAVSCSGHGRTYLDGSFLDNGTPVCECNSCYSGHDCSMFMPECMLDADSGNPVFLEPFWMQNSASSAVVIPGWHRMGYEFLGETLISKELEMQIRKIHASVGNAVTTGKYLIFGAGSTQLLNAAVYALSPHGSAKSTAKVVATSPYYPVYKSQTELFESEKYRFSGDASVWKNNADSSSMNFIEFVTSPNNPDGQLKKANLHGSNVKTVHDLAYYWPHFTAIPAPLDEDLMIFTLSKLTGHAGTRFGWALIKDKDVYERMLEYTNLNTYGVPREVQLRALKLLKVVLQGSGRDLFEFGYETMKNRWEKLNKVIILGSSCFSIQDQPPEYCKYFETIRSPSPAFAWIKCEREEDEDCHNVLRGASITGREGRAFGAESRYVRLSVCQSQDDFNLILHRLKMLVSSNEAKVMAHSDPGKETIAEIPSSSFNTSNV